MENRCGVNGTIHNNIFFTEKAIPGQQPMKRLRVEISRQNSNLTEVKSKLAAEAIAIGANAVMSFRYGQKKHSTLELIFSLKWDTESWHGEGDAIKL